MHSTTTLTRGTPCCLAALDTTTLLLRLVSWGGGEATTLLSWRRVRACVPDMIHICSVTRVMQYQITQVCLSLIGREPGADGVCRV